MKIYPKSIFLLLILCLFLLPSPACTPRPPSLVEAQAAAATAAPPEEETYLLGPEDLIEISVWKEPELTKQMVVRPDGKISYPLLGDVQAAGLTVKQLQNELLKRLEKFVTDAHVTVILVKAQYYKIYVTGKVNKPGEFLVGRAPTVMQAIAMAGGLTPFASPGNIIILRKAAGKEEVFSFDFKSVSRGESLEQDRALLPGDVVVVP
jgi:polysaccharide export outer membrane protein